MHLTTKGLRGLLTVSLYATIQTTGTFIVGIGVLLVALLGALLLGIDLGTFLTAVRSVLWNFVLKLQDNATGYLWHVPVYLAYLLTTVLTTRLFARRTPWPRLLSDLGLSLRFDRRFAIILLSLTFTFSTCVSVGEYLLATGSAPPSIEALEYVTIVAKMAVGAGLGIFAEEIAYRGFALRTLNRMYGPRVAILYSSVLFSISHFATEPFSLERSLSLFLLGTILAYTFILTESLWTSTAVHLGWDLGTLSWTSWVMVARPNYIARLALFQQSFASVLGVAVSATVVAALAGILRASCRPSKVQG